MNNKRLMQCNLNTIAFCFKKKNFSLLQYMKVFNDPKLDKYFNPKIGLKSIDKFAKQHKLTAQQIRKLKSLEVFQTHKIPRKNPKLFNTITSPNRLHNVQIDLMDVIDINPVVNRKVRYLFNIIDVYSRFVWVFPITNKRAKTIADIFSKWLKTVKRKYKKIPKSVNSDDGNEFKASFKTVLKNNNIEHFVFASNIHHNAQGIIERFHRTLRNLIQRYLDVYNTKKYIDILPKLIENYNNTIHTTLKTTPSKVLAGSRKQKQKINRAEFIPIGSKIRTLLNRGAFAKGTKPRWSKTLYLITGYDKLGHIIKNIKTGATLKRTYKRFELQKIDDVTETIQRKTRQSKKAEQQIKEEQIKKKLKRFGVPRVATDQPRQLRERKK